METVLTVRRPRFWRSPAAPPLGWMAFTALALAAALASARLWPAWFSSDGAALLAEAAQTGPGDVARWAWRRPSPGGALLAWGLLRLFGWHYAPWEILQTFLWLGMLAAYAAMLRQLWGHARPALLAAAVAALTLGHAPDLTLDVSRLGYPLAMGAGLASVGVAVEGWRRCRPGVIALGWGLALPAVAAYPAAVLWLPLLHAAGAVIPERPRRRARTVWGAAAIGLALTVAMAGLVGLGVPLSAGAAWRRWLASAELYRHGAPAVAVVGLAGLAGLAQGLRLPVRAWPIVLGLAAAMAGLALGVHPLPVVVALTVMVPRAWPFALWALLLQAMLALDGGAWALHRLQFGLAAAPVLAMGLWRSPVPLWVRSWLDRTRSLNRGALHSLLLLLAALGVAHGHAQLREYARVRAELGARRLLWRDAVWTAVRDLPPDAWLAVAAEADGHGAPAVASLLAAHGRADVSVSQAGPDGETGAWLLAMGVGERELLRWTAPTQPPPLVLRRGLHWAVLRPAGP